MLNCPSSTLRTTNTAAAMAPTPAARPSIVSSQLTVLRIATSQKTVTGSTSSVGSTI